MSKTAGAMAVNNRVQVSDAAKKKAAGNLEKGRGGPGHASDARSERGKPRTQLDATLALA